MKKKLINHLENDIYCRLGVSKISGIGVIAIKNIPKNTNPFKTLSNEKDKVVELTDKDIKNVNPNVKKILNDFFGNNKKYDVLYYGPNHLNISFYLNHSNNSNLDIIKTKNTYLDFITNRNIKKDEELTINYSKYE
jgi:SET domain-containing protein